MNGFLPAAGRLHRFEIPEVEGVRVDGGVESGDTVSTNYDPMLAKVIGYGRTREEATRPAGQGTALRPSPGSDHEPCATRGNPRERRLHRGTNRHRTSSTGSNRRTWCPPSRPASKGQPRSPRRSATRQRPGQRHRPWHGSAPGSAPSARSCRHGPMRRGDQAGRGRVPPRTRPAVRGRRRDSSTCVVHRCTPDRVDMVVEGIRRHFDVLRAGDACYVVAGPAGPSPWIRFPASRTRTTPSRRARCSHRCREQSFASTSRPGDRVVRRRDGPGHRGNEDGTRDQSHHRCRRRERPGRIRRRRRHRHGAHRA